MLQEFKIVPQVLHRYATPLITGLFLVSLVSGAALFFHLGSSWFRDMHEWLSLVLALPFVLHIWRNWKPMVSYVRRPPFAIAMAASLAAAAAFVVLPGEGGSGGPPQFALSHAIVSHPAVEVAPLVGTTPEALVASLKAKGFTAADSATALADIATKSGKSEFELIAALLPPTP